MWTFNETFSDIELWIGQVNENFYSACLRNSVAPLRFCSFCFDRNSEMEGRRELNDVLNWREFFFEGFETCWSS
jgi:hypothetical protein